MQANDAALLRDDYRLRAGWPVSHFGFPHGGEAPPMYIPDLVSHF